MYVIILTFIQAAYTDMIDFECSMDSVMVSSLRTKLIHNTGNMANMKIKAMCQNAYKALSSIRQLQLQDDID